MDRRARTDTNRVAMNAAVNGTRTLGNAAVGTDALRSFASDVIARIAEAGALPPRKAQPIEMIERFCDALIADDSDASRAMVGALQDAGMSPDALCLDVLAPAACRLGERWVDDTATFFDVTLGLGRLHAALRQVQRAFGEAQIMREGDLTALFAPLPGDTHAFGPTMAAGFFRRAGWAVDLPAAPDLDHLLEMAATKRYALIGLSSGCATMMAAMAETVQRVREVAPGSLIALGGAITAADEDCQRKTGADLICTDVARDAVQFGQVIRAGWGGSSTQKAENGKKRTENYARVE